MNAGPNLMAAREAFYAELAPRALAPLWTVLKLLVTPEPVTPIVPHRWAYDDVRPYLTQAGELITAKEAERRVLVLENPALPGEARITRTLYAGLQLILPGEVAPCHRHSQSALRFVLEGDGAYTAVDGERAVMRPFDLILTPGGRWHDHGNDSDAPMVWLDGLDIPMVTAFDASFSEHLDGRAQHPPRLPPGDCQQRWGANLRPVRSSPAAATQLRAPLFHYPYDCWYPALMAMAASEAPDSAHGTLMEFVDPSSGGPILPTMSAYCRHLPAGFETRLHKQTDGQIFVGVSGNGIIGVGDAEFEIAPRDVVVVPAWSSYRLVARSDMVLFSYSDRAAQDALQFWQSASPLR